MTLPPYMRAVVLTGHGGLDKLVYREDWPTPTPGPDEVVVKVGACGLNNTDINTRTAWYAKTVTDGITEAGGRSGYAQADAAQGSWSNTALTFPRIQGADATGRIAAVGAGVDPRRIGERVLIDPWLFGPGEWLDPENAAYFGSECDGGFAEFTKVRASNALRIETALSDAELATFPCAMQTAEYLVGRTRLLPGETVVIAGASGGVGTAAIQLCRLRGARVIGIASIAKEQTLQQLGCETVIDRGTDGLDAAIRKAAGGPVDVAVDVVGGATFMALIGALRQGGRYSTSGAISGPDVRFDLRQLIYKDLQLTGATIAPPGTFQRLVKLIERGQLRPVLAQAFPLQELGRAQEVFLQKGHVGNIVVTM